MQYLIGMLITFSAFMLMLLINGRKKDILSSEILLAWKEANHQSRIKNDTLKRIAEALEESK